MPELLTLDAVVAGYGSVPVLHELDVRVDEGEIAVILGANGMGKTTTLRAISGLIRTWAGRIRLRDRPIERLSTEAIVKLGIGFVPEPPGVFADMSVRDNLRVGAFGLKRASSAQVGERIEFVTETFEPLAKRMYQLGGSLSGGEQRMLAVARALMGDPTLLLVDEASMGLSPVMTSEVFDLLGRVRDTGVTLCMVEQNASVLDLADRAYVIEKGRVVHAAQGDALSRMRDDVTRAYLGAAS